MENKTCNKCIIKKFIYKLKKFISELFKNDKDEFKGMKDIKENR